MQYVDYTSYNKAVKNAAQVLGLDEKTVNKVYRAYCRTIIDNLSKLQFDNITEEEFNNLQTSVNLPSIGKIYCTWKEYQNELKRKEYVQKAKENKAAKH